MGRHRAERVNAEPGPGRRQRLAQAFSYLALLIMCAAIMVVALVIGALAALTGASAGGLLGMGLVGLFLASLIVFMWELLRRDPLDCLTVPGDLAPVDLDTDGVSEQDPGATGADDQGQYPGRVGQVTAAERAERDEDQHRETDRVNAPESGPGGSAVPMLRAGGHGGHGSGGVGGQVARVHSQTHVSPAELG